MNFQRSQLLLLDSFYDQPLRPARLLTRFRSYVFEKKKKKSYVFGMPNRPFMG